MGRVGHSAFFKDKDILIISENAKKINFYAKRFVFWEQIVINGVLPSFLCGYAFYS